MDGVQGTPAEGVDAVVAGTVGRPAATGWFQRDGRTRGATAGR